MAHHIVQAATEGPDGRRTAPAALRNAGPLQAALAQRLPARGRVLEIASGTGQHAAAFAMAFPALQWVPSDIDPAQRDSIRAWRAHCGAPNLAEPLAIDVAAPWPVPPGDADAVVTVNLLHLIPEALVALFFDQARVAVRAGGALCLYGPFLRGSGYASDGDRAFDADLRARDPAIGYKSIDAVVAVADKAGWSLAAQDALPANNLLLSFAAR